MHKLCPSISVGPNGRAHIVFVCTQLIFSFISITFISVFCIKLDLDMKPDYVNSELSATPVKGAHLMPPGERFITCDLPVEILVGVA